MLREIAGRKTELLSLLSLGTGNASGDVLTRLVPRPRESPLSFGQQRLWFLNQLEPESLFYNLPAAVVLCGALQFAAFEQSLGEVIRRHDVLRCTFNERDEGPMQVATPSVKIAILMSDLRGLVTSCGEVQARALALLEARRAFDLREGPLVRVTLMRVGEEEYVALFTMHHIVSDGWSMGVLVREVSELYERMRGGEESGLEELKVQYSDYAVWQRERMKGEVLEEEISYWREQLRGMEVLEFPTDRARPAVQRYKGKAERIWISKGVTEGLKRVSRREGATMFMTLLGGLSGLLMRYTGQEDIGVGVPVAGRNQVELEGLIGFFVNTLVMRTRLGGNPSFGEVVKRVREVVLEGDRHQEIPFEKLVEELQPERDMSRSPLFQVMLTLEDGPAERLRLGGVNARWMESETSAAKFDLTLGINETDEGLRGSLVYNTELFELTTISRLIGHFKMLLKAATDDPSIPLSECMVLNHVEVQQLLEWNATDAQY